MQTRKAAPESKLRPTSHYFSASEEPHLLKPAFSARFPFFSRDGRNYIINISVFQQQDIFTLKPVHIPLTKRLLGRML